MNQSQALRDKLKGEIQKVGWDALEPHVQRDALIVIDPVLDLTEVAIAAAEDCSDLMELWVDRGWLYKPSAEQLEKFQATSGDVFDFVIVQPFVFTQLPKDQNL